MPASEWDKPAKPQLCLNPACRTRVTNPYARLSNGVTCCRHCTEAVEHAERLIHAAGLATAQQDPYNPQGDMFKAVIARNTLLTEGR